MNPVARTHRRRHSSVGFRETVFWLFTAVLLAFLVRLHLLADLTLPTPWVDEAHFMWPAASFAADFSLFAPELDPNRVILWMPPGFTVVLGIVFRILGVSLVVARSVSLAALLVAVAALALIVRRYPLRFLSLLVLGAYFCTGVVTACGNVARPEALMIMLASLGVWVLLGPRPFSGLILLALTPLIHPAGAFFLLGALIGQAVRARLTDSSWRFGRREAGMLLAVALLWALYALFAVANWANFWHDMTYQFARKSGRDLLTPLATPENLLILVLLLLAVAYGVKNRLPSLGLLTLAVPAWIVFLLGHEMWYHVYQSLAWALFSIVIIHTGHHMLCTPRRPGCRVLPATVLTVLVAATFGMGYAKGLTPTQANHPPAIAWQDMKTPSEIPYFLPEDRAAITHLLDSLATDNEELVVQFLPRAEAFLQPEILEGRVKTIAPVFADLKADAYIIHCSRYLTPSVYLQATKDDIAAAGARSLEDGILFHQRDAWERWYLFVRGRHPVQTSRQPYQR